MILMVLATVKFIPVYVCKIGTSGGNDDTVARDKPFSYKDRSSEFI